MSGFALNKSFQYSRAVKTLKQTTPSVQTLNDNEHMKINPDDLVLMNDYAASHPVVIELAYAQDDNLLFGEAIYRTDAGLWLHKDLASVVLDAAQNCYRAHGYRFVLYDGLRTVEAQDKMLHTRRVQHNPHWLQPPRLLSPPGAGAHPRAMAIDLDLIDEKGHKPDMGTPFDYLAENPYPQHNPAHREYQGHSAAIMEARTILTQSMLNAAQKRQTDLQPLPEEWWDFRLPHTVYSAYDPLSEKDLKPQQKLLSA